MQPEGKSPPISFFPTAAIHLLSRGGRISRL
jgi:hypothetical protein